MFTMGAAFRSLQATAVSDPHYSNVLALINFDGQANGSQTVIDVTGNSTVTVTGSSSIDTANFKYGTGSWKNNSNGYFKVAVGSTGLFAGDFTWECWVKNAGTGDVIMNSEDTGSYVYNGSWANYGGPTFNVDHSSLTGSVFTHIVICREGSTMRSYRNGVQVGTATWAGNVDLRNTRYGFFGPNNNLWYTGYIDSLRITKNVCRYTGGTSFTPPTDDFPTQ